MHIPCSGGLGQIDHSHLHKKKPDIGMLIVKIGGPAYRIGMGGGAASSVPSGSNRADLDFNAVQVKMSFRRGRCCNCSCIFCTVDPCRGWLRGHCLPGLARGLTAEPGGRPGCQPQPVSALATVQIVTRHIQ